MVFLTYRHRVQHTMATALLGGDLPSRSVTDQPRPLPVVAPRVSRASAPAPTAAGLGPLARCLGGDLAAVKG